MTCEATKSADGLRFWCDCAGNRRSIQNSFPSHLNESMFIERHPGLEPREFVFFLRFTNFMNKLRIPLTFALAVIVVLSTYAQQRHKPSLTAADAAISQHGDSLVQQRQAYLPL